MIKKADTFKESRSAVLSRCAVTAKSAVSQLSLLFLSYILAALGHGKVEFFDVDKLAAPNSFIVDGLLCLEYN